MSQLDPLRVGLETGQVELARLKNRPALCLADHVQADGPNGAARSFFSLFKTKINKKIINLLKKSEENIDLEI